MPDFAMQKQVFSSLDTSYRTIQNKIRFTPVENIDRNVKKANIEAMKYYISDKTNEIKQTLLLEKMNEWILLDYPEIDPKRVFFVSPDNLKNLPLEVVINYNREIIDYKNACLLDYAERQFSSYIKSLKKTNRYLEWSNDITRDTGLKKIVTRYSDFYRDKIIKRMNWLMWTYGNENCCLLTLTIDPKKYNYDKFEMWTAISKKYERFIEKLKIYFKRHNRPFPPYLWGVESMYGRPENNYIARGNPHLHVCFFNCKYLAPVEKIEKNIGVKDS
jgi:hypothetical protein